LIWLLISELEEEASSRAAVQTGTDWISGGKSHSRDRPTNRSAQPSAQTISVQLGSSETIRIEPYFPAADSSGMRMQ
jgi:hypothetical protein